MSKKMKGVLLDPSPHGAYGDAKTRLKHQALMQDYQELEKEAEGMRNKLGTMKQRKLTLLAEVSFLRQRHKFLMKNRSSEPPKQRERVKQQNFEIKQKNIKKRRIHSRKEGAHQNPPPVFYVNQKERIYSTREPYIQNPTSILDLNQKGRIYDGKEATFPNPPMALELKLKERIHCTKEGSWKIEAPFLNQKERVYGGKEVAVQNRAPIFDLNQISREEEDFEGGSEPLEVQEPTNHLIGGGDEQRNDLRLSICRNVSGGPSTAGKRKISWQDQVALRV